MKRITILSAAALAFAILVPSSHADSNARHERCRAAHDKRMLAAGDANGDGKLDDEERHKLHEAKRAEALRAYDKDGDGRLSPKERAVQRHDRMVERFEELDKSGDASITLAEATNGCGPLADHFADVDADGDGAVSWTEFESHAARRPPHRRRGGNMGGPGGCGPRGR